jgi:tRNA(Ile)-lysidine synthase
MVTLFAKRGLYERFCRATRSLGWRESRRPILLGLSGGRDSVVLLHLVKVSGCPVIAAHLNHHLRGRESDRDEQSVRRLCRAWATPLVVGHARVGVLARRYARSPEEAARIARYRFLEQTARRLGLREVAVAHHQRDQAETVLLKIFRGSRRSELRGMRKVASFPLLDWKKRQTGRGDKTPLRLVRPLLEAPIEEIVRYARQNRLPFREDSSNRNLFIPRNWIRRRLLPLVVRRLNRNIVPALARLGSE